MPMIDQRLIITKENSAYIINILWLNSEDPPTPLEGMFLTVTVFFVFPSDYTEAFWTALPLDEVHKEATDFIRVNTLFRMSCSRRL